jgi:Fe-S-cluster containining protein
MFDKTQHAAHHGAAMVVSDMIAPGTGPVSDTCAGASPADTDSSRICVECASRGHTCCQGHDIYVTLGDCRRIACYSGAADFFEYRGCCRAAYADQGDDPVWQQHVFRSDGSRRVLKHRVDAACIFLGPGGCGLPLAVRPLVCRLYPHLYSAGRIYGAWDDECPAARIQDRSALERGIAGVQRQEAEQWHRMLYTEILWEADSDEHRLNL